MHNLKVKKTLDLNSNRVCKIKKYESFQVRENSVVEFEGRIRASVRRKDGAHGWATLKLVAEDICFAWPSTVAVEAQMQLVLGKKYRLPMESITGWIFDQKFDLSDLPPVAMAMKDHLLFSQLCKHSYCQITQQDEKGNTALLMAAENNDLEAMKVFQSKGLSILHNNKEGVGAIHLAAKNGNLEMIHHILQHKENVIDSTDQYGSTALVYAAEYEQWETVLFLLSNGASKLQKDSSGNDALLIAAEAGDLLGAKTLMKAEWDVHTTNYNRETILHVAARNGHLGVLRYFIKEIHLDINLVDRDSQTVLHTAIRANQLKCVQFLLEHCKPDLARKEKGGRTPLKLGPDLGGKCFEVNSYLEFWASNNLRHHGPKPSNKKRNRFSGKRRHYR